MRHVTRMMVTVQRRLLTASLVAVVLVVVCGMALGVQGHQSQGEPRASELADIQARADAARASWLGDAEAHQAAGVVQAYQDNGATSECMAQAGVDWDWRRSINGGSPVTGGLAGSVWAAAPDKWAQLPRYDGDNVWQSVVEKALRTPLSESDDAAYARCKEQAPQPRIAIDYRVLGDEYTLPAAAQDLDGEWQAALAGLDQKVASTEDYYACIDRSDLPGTRQKAEDPPNRVAAQAWSLEPPGSFFAKPDQPEDTSWRQSPEWRRFQDDTREFARQEFACRADTYPKAVTRADTLLTEFTTKHQDQIAALQRRWVEVERQARLVGWSPDQPHAGYHESVDS